jgi:tetratricopeptide (TPR) repeat protein
VLGDVPVPRVRLRYGGLVEGGVDDAFELRMVAAAPMTLPQALATLRLSGWDSQVFLSLFSGLLELAPGLSGTARHDLAVALDRVWASWFPIGESTDLALCVGLLQSSIGRHRTALSYFARSLEQRGPNASAWLGAALAHHAMDEPEDAVKAVLEALALEPDLDAARALLVELDSFAGIGV